MTVKSLRSFSTSSTLFNISVRFTISVGEFDFPVTVFCPVPSRIVFVVIVSDFAIFTFVLFAESPFVVEIVRSWCRGRVHVVAIVYRFSNTTLVGGTFLPYKAWNIYFDVTNFVLRGVVDTTNRHGRKVNTVWPAATRCLVHVPENTERNGVFGCEFLTFKL